MKPAPFKYVVAESVDEVVATLADYGDEAKILAGGQSLVPLMNLRLAVPGVLVDLNRVAELQGIRANGHLEIAAMTRQSAAERSTEVRSSAPLIGLALRHVSHPSIRSRGTIGGSVAHADPAAELPAVLVALGAEVVARGPAGVRTISADELFVGYFTTALAEDEVLTHVRVPNADLRVGFQEVARRSGDFALAGAAVALTHGADGTCAAARIVLFGVSDVPLRASGAEQALAGRKLGDEAALDDVQKLVEAEIDPKSDAHASAAYRKRVAGVLARRALVEAATGGEGR